MLFFFKFLFVVQEKLDAVGATRGVDVVAGDRLFLPQDILEGDASTNKSLKSKLGSAGSKVKASYKLRAQTSRIVSSFKAPSVVSSLLRDYSGHKDGVWQVTTKIGQPIIGKII